MTDQFRSLAPMAYFVGALVWVDQVTDLAILAWSPQSATSVGRFQFAVVAVARGPVLGVALLLMIGAAVLLGHRRVVRWLAGVVVVLALGMLTAATLAAGFEAPLQLPAGQTGLSVGWHRVRAVTTGFLAVAVLVYMAVIAVSAGKTSSIQNDTRAVPGH